MKKVYRTADGLHIDVRGLPPPEPMVEIIRLIANTDTQPPVFAHLDRDPVYLYPELSEHGWLGELVSEAAGEVVIRLSRAET